MQIQSLISARCAVSLLVLVLPACAPTARHHPPNTQPDQSMNESSFRGIYTVVYRVPDLEQAKAWYRSAFGAEPYFDEPFYVGFDIAGYELGLQPEEGEDMAGAGGAVAYWGVANAEAALQRLLAIGAARHSDVQEVGGGIRVAAVKDPFGNVLGIIENPQFRGERR